MLLNVGPVNGAGIACFDGNVWHQAQFGQTPTFGKANVAGQNCQGNQPRRGQAEFKIYF
jgi:hypothetical protein